MERSCLVSDVRPTLVRGEPDKYLKSGPVEVPRKDRKVFIARTGQIGWSVFPIIIVWPERNGSVLDILIRTDIRSGLMEFGSKVTSPGDRWMAGE